MTTTMHDREKTVHGMAKPNFRGLYISLLFDSASQFSINQSVAGRFDHDYGVCHYNLINNHI